MNRRAWRPAALAAAAMALTASCGYAAGIYSARIPADRLEGRWVGAGGASLTFHADHTFTGENLDTYPVASRCTNPADPAGPASGTWAFWAPSEPGSTSFTVQESATRGSSVALSFGDQGCGVTVYLYGGDDDPSMCPARDADAGCATTGYLRRSGEDG